MNSEGEALRYGTPPKIIIFVSPREEANKYLERLKRILTERGWEILQIVRLGKNVDKGSLMVCDFVLTLGGDGTILYASREVSKYGKPILGINLGRVGLLTELSPEEFLEKIDGIERGEFRVVETMKIIARGSNEMLQPVLNEYVLMTSKPGKIIGLQIFVDEEFIAKVLCDGLIVSTPIGSTSYALSAGGPVVSDQIEAMIIVPIAPLYRAMYPLLVPSRSIIKVKIETGWADAWLIADGNIIRKVKKGCEVVFKRADEKARFIRVRHSLSRIRKVMSLVGLNVRGKP